MKKGKSISNPSGNLKLSSTYFKSKTLRSNSTKTFSAIFTKGATAELRNVDHLQRSFPRWGFSSFSMQFRPSVVALSSSLTMF